MKLLSTLLLLGLTLIGTAWGAPALPPTGPYSPIVPVVDGCPPGYARNLQADCAPVQRPPPGPGYGMPAPNYAPGYRPSPCQPGFHVGQDGRCWPNRPACPPNQHLGADGKCWPCPPGQQYREGRCYPCPAGQHIGPDGRCYNNQPRPPVYCPPGLSAGIDGRCYRY